MIGQFGFPLVFIGHHMAVNLLDWIKLYGPCMAAIAGS